MDPAELRAETLAWLTEHKDGLASYRPQRRRKSAADQHLQGMRRPGGKAGERADPGRLVRPDRLGARGDGRPGEGLERDLGAMPGRGARMDDYAGGSASDLDLT